MIKDDCDFGQCECESCFGKNCVDGCKTCTKIKIVKMKIVYIAHPYENNQANLINAESWVGYLIRRFNIAPICSWISWCKTLSEDYREMGLTINKELIRRCDELWMVGGRISTGMKIEKEFAELMGIPVTDLTHLGYEVPKL